MKTLGWVLVLVGLLASCTAARYYATQAPQPLVVVEPQPLVHEHYHHETLPIPERKPDPPTLPQALDQAIWHLQYAHGVLKDRQNAPPP